MLIQQRPQGLTHVTKLDARLERKLMIGDNCVLDRFVFPKQSVPNSITYTITTTVLV